MTLTQLKTLLAVIETGSFSAAALALDTAQSAVSYAVAELERELEVKLLERGRFGARPTDVGERVAAHARRLLSFEAAIVQEADLERGTLRGTLRVATFRSVASRILPKTLARMARRYPEVQVQLIETDSEVDETERILLSGKVDLAFFQAPYPREALSWDLFHDPYVALLPKDHPLANASISRAELVKSPLILYDSDDHCSVKTNTYLRGTAPTRAHKTYTVREDSTIFSLVEQGLGVSVVPQLAFADLPDSVARVPLAEPLERVIGVSILPHSLKVPAVRAFLDTLKVQFPESSLPGFKPLLAARSV